VTVQLERLTVRCKPSEVPLLLTKLRAEWGVRKATIHVGHNDDCPYADTLGLVTDCDCETVLTILVPVPQAA
jgi:hypothetical protein